MAGVLVPVLALWAAAAAGSAAAATVLPPEPRLADDDWGSPLFAADPSTIPPPQPRAVKLTELSAEERRTYTLQPGRYYFLSPRFPRPYPNNARARWTLRGAQGQAVTVWCPRFSLQSSAGCRRDYLAFNGRRRCGNLGSLPPTSATVLDISFRSDRSGQARGFFCRVSVPSGGGATTVATTAATTATTASPAPGARCCGVVNRRSRIVGGVETQVNEYPWMAGLVSRGGTRTYCGGSVINNRYVLSAAHCTINSRPSNVQVLLREHRIGQSDGELRFSVSRIINHPSYRSVSGTGYDFSLLRLTTTINFSTLGNRVAPVCLPSGGSFDNVAAIVTGWGTTSEGGSQATRLREVTVRTQTNTQCRRSYGSSINPTMICAGVSGGGRDSCQGDSGGPLFTTVAGRQTQIGVVSWGSGCARPNLPGVYARVTAVSGWIAQNTADASLC